MTTEERDKTNLESLTDIEPVIAGRRLKPFSAGRLQLCRRVGLQIVTAGAGELDQPSLENELLAFYYIHAFPLDDVRASCAFPRDEFFEKVIQPLSFDFPARELPKVMAFMEREFSGIEAANVDVVAKPGGGGSPTPPPNS